MSRSVRQDEHVPRSCTKVCTASLLCRPREQLFALKVSYNYANRPSINNYAALQSLAVPHRRSDLIPDRINGFRGCSWTPALVRLVCFSSVFFYIASPQRGDLRLSGPPPGQGGGGGARIRVRRFPADLRVDSLATEPPTPSLVR
ncbi:hypothetical protein PoB_000906000 [Plakobranchus ocellatus]|uniref:Uncharacterized protein n=1 Tax=Plakobranchus ocellatus TaxID=259542 RepID=A0AAV3YJ77_9GAST|nr:hypothetical protein PoB_000906000 [Plakobranchus ocellatus]